jgi:NADH-quinone oxidoreductase subunit J
MDLFFFALFALIAVVSAINVVVQTHPIASALSLVGVMASLAILYLLLGGEFIAMAQIIVYAGAVMVLFIFVIMVLNAGAETQAKPGSWFAKVAGIPLVAILLGLLAYFLGRQYPNAEPVLFGTLKDATGHSLGSAQSVGIAIFTTYLLPFEVTSVLILIAIIGAIVLARKELD